MKATTISVVLTTLVTFATLLFSHASMAHHDKHSGFSVNTRLITTGVLTTRSGLARNYFNYSYSYGNRNYDVRRAKKLAKYYRTEQRLHRHHYHHTDCPYTGYDHYH